MGGQILQLESERLERMGIDKGRTLQLYTMVEDGGTTPEYAAKALKITTEILYERMKKAGYQYPS